MGQADIPQGTARAHACAQPFARAWCDGRCGGGGARLNACLARYVGRRARPSACVHASRVSRASGPGRAGAAVCAVVDSGLVLLCCCPAAVLLPGCPAARLPFCCPAARLPFCPAALLLL